MRTAKRSSNDLRVQILKAVVPFLKRHGTDGASVDEIMKAAGFTSGALYSQFKNKEDLCTQAVCSALDAMLDSYQKIVRERGRDGLKLIVSKYLTEAHAGNVSDGCTFAALGSHMAKATPSAKRAYEGRIQALVQIFVDGLGAGPEKERRAKAQQMLSSMLGALTFARAMGGADASKDFLSSVKAQVLRDLDAPMKERRRP
jgi:TetR/AcrR family transcriptional repressor of nem operon